jgi:predicted metal-dependent peptidase
MCADIIEFKRPPCADQDPARALENTVVRLLKERPFYGHLLLGCRRRFVPGTHAVGVTIAHGTPVLCIDPERFTVLNRNQQLALLEHGIKHILHLHPMRGSDYHRLTWDVSADLAINPSVANLPPGALLPDRFGLEPGLAAEEYARVLTARFNTGNLAGEGVGNASRDQGGQVGSGPDDLLAEASEAGLLDDHAVWAEAESTPLRLAEQVVRDQVREAHRKSGGDVPEDVRELVESWLAPPRIPWQQVLRQFVATAGRVGRKNSWQREHRRFQHDTPGTRKRHRLNLLVAIDVSESTDERPLRESFARELLQIARGRDSRITVLYAHSRIRRIEQFNSSQVVAEVFPGGGFTDLRPVFEYARTMHPLPAAVIYLTDGYGPAPAKMEFPTLWVLTEDGQKPTDWGVELRLGGGE